MLIGFIMPCLTSKEVTHMTDNENMGFRRISRSSNSTLKILCKASEQKEKGYKLDRNKANSIYSKPGLNFVAEFRTASYELAKSSFRYILQHCEQANSKTN